MAGSVNPNPYEYPQSPHIRRHGPSGWDQYTKYRQWLRDEFAFRCVYCLDRERWRDMRQPLQIDHFQPQALNPNLACVYSNLLYLCPACNRLKSTSILPDPCAVALGDCLRVYESGRIEGLTAEGDRLIDVLALDTAHARDRRRIIIGTIASLAQSNSNMFQEWMRFPDDLPDLSQPPAPPNNSRPVGIIESYFERRRINQLPDCY